SDAYGRAKESGKHAREHLRRMFAQILPVHFHGIRRFQTKQRRKAQTRFGHTDLLQPRLHWWVVDRRHRRIVQASGLAARARHWAGRGHSSNRLRKRRGSARGQKPMSAASANERTATLAPSPRGGRRVGAEEGLRRTTALPESRGTQGVCS